MKYDERSVSDSWLSSVPVDDAITAMPVLVRRLTELNEKSAVGSAPLMCEIAPLWQASSTTMVIVAGSATSRARRSPSGSSSPARFSAFARAWPE